MSAIKFTRLECGAGTAAFLAFIVLGVVPAVYLSLMYLTLKSQSESERMRLRMKILFILNEAPYGTERSYNALRLANALAETDRQIEITIFLTADAVACAKKGQKTPEGSRNLERMLKRFAAGNHQSLLDR